jgi:hypothetical protein
MKRTIAILMTSMLVTVACLAAESATMLSKKEVRILTEKASTPAEHTLLAQYYRFQAEKLEAEANEHAEEAKIHHAHPPLAESKHIMNPDTEAHCKYFADKLQKEAAKARTLAASHAEMASKSSEQTNKVPDANSIPKETNSLSR